MSMLIVWITDIITSMGILVVSMIVFLVYVIVGTIIKVIRDE